MSKARAFAAVLFVGLLATPIVYKRVLAHRQAAESARQSTRTLNTYGFRLQECAEDSGISFKHQAPTLDPKLDHIMPQVASMGAAVSVVDFDRDGWADIYVTNSGEG